jgi:hypothetical protein
MQALDPTVLAQVYLETKYLRSFFGSFYGVAISEDRLEEQSTDALEYWELTMHSATILTPSQEHKGEEKKEDPAQYPAEKKCMRHGDYARRAHRTEKCTAHVKESGKPCKRFAEAFGLCPAHIDSEHKRQLIDDAFFFQTSCNCGVDENTWLTNIKIERRKHKMNCDKKKDQRIALSWSENLKQNGATTCSCHSSRCAVNHGCLLAYPTYNQSKGPRAHDLEHVNVTDVHKRHVKRRQSMTVLKDGSDLSKQGYKEYGARFLHNVTFEDGNPPPRART